jgi:cyanate permease
MAKTESQGGKLFPVNNTINPSLSRYRWVMLGLIWISYCMFGMASRSLSPLITPIVRDLSISNSQIGIVLGSWQLVYIIVALIGGALIDRWGIRKSLFLGIIAIGLSLILRYFINSYLVLLICVAIFGLGGPMVSIGSPKTISEWFSEKDRSRAVSIYTTGQAVGGLISFSAINSVIMPITGYSWRLTFFYLSLPVFAAAVLWWYLARDVKREKSGTGPNILNVFASLIRIRKVQLVLVIVFLFFLISHGFTNWLPNFLEAGGLSPATAGLAASIPLIVMIPSVLVIPMLTPTRWRKYLLAITTLLMGLLLFLMSRLTGSSLITSLVFWGILTGYGLPLLVLILMDIQEVGSRYMGSAGGLLFCIGEMGGFLGPSLVGIFRDISGNFSIAMIFLSVLSFIITAIALFLKK